MTSTLHYLCHPPSLTLSSVLYAATPVAAPRPSSPRSLNRAALEEVLQHESAARPVCGSRSEATTKCSRPNGSPKGKRSAAKPSSPPSHPSLFDILLIFFNLTKAVRKHTNAVQKPTKAVQRTTNAVQCKNSLYSWDSMPYRKISSFFPHFPKDSRFPPFPAIPRNSHRGHPHGC